MVEISVRRVKYEGETPQLLESIKIYVRTRKFVLGYDTADDHGVREGFVISYLSKEDRQLLKPATDLLGHVYASSNIILWVYTHSSGEIAIVQIPSRAARNAFKLTELCKTPLPPSEVMFMLELANG